VDFEALSRGSREQLNEAQRILAEEIAFRDRNPASVEDEPAEPLWAAADCRQREAEALLAELLVELGEEHAGQIANGLRVEEVELHEALDGRFPGPVGVVHDLRDARLIVEVEPLLGAAGEQVQVAAHGPEEALGPVEATEFGGGEQPGLYEICRTFDAVDIFADPVQRVEVAKAALAVLDVGLDDVAAVAHAQVPRIALRKLGGDIFGSGAGDHLLAEARGGGIEQFLVAPQPPRLEAGGADGDVLLRQRDQLADRANRMADLELQIPQQVQGRFGGALLVGIRGFRGQEHEIEIAERRHLAAPRAAKADERNRLGSLSRQALADEVPGEADKLIVEEGGRLRRGAPVAGVDR